jgi:ParB family chromosome partitioning protein
MEKKALGRGLDALLPTGRTTAEPERGDVQELRLEAIVPNRFQPRQQFSELELAELTASLKENGLLQPILVRRKGDGIYELIAGERRLRAAKLAGMQKIPALVRNVSDQESMVLALVENLQRDDLNPMETARAYQRMLNEFGLTQEAIAQKVACDRSSVANMLRLTSLPAEVQHMIEIRSIVDRACQGHSRAHDPGRADQLGDADCGVSNCRCVKRSGWCRGTRRRKRPGKRPVQSPPAVGP